MKTRVLLSLLLTACGTPTPPSPIPLDLARWHRFSWASVTADGIRFDRAAIRVVDSLSNRSSSSVLLQLDLAGSGTMPFGFPSSTVPDPARGRLHGLLHGHGPVTVATAPNEPESGPLDQIGSFGLPSSNSRHSSSISPGNGSAFSLPCGTSRPRSGARNGPPVSPTIARASSFPSSPAAGPSRCSSTPD